MENLNYSLQRRHNSIGGNKECSNAQMMTVVMNNHFPRAFAKVAFPGNSGKIPKQKTAGHLFQGQKDNKGKTNRPQKTSANIKLTIATSKHVYLLGQSIDILAYLENTGQRDYYIRKDISSFHSSSGSHVLSITIVNQDNKPIQIPLIASDPLAPPENNYASASEFIKSHYILLKPGYMYGVRNIIKINLASGVYKLRLSYREVFPILFQHEILSEMDIPILTHPLTSNIVKITVHRKKTKQ